MHLMGVGRMDNDPKGALPIYSYCFVSNNRLRHARIKAFKAFWVDMKRLRRPSALGNEGARVESHSGNRINLLLSFFCVCMILLADCVWAMMRLMLLAGSPFLLPLIVRYMLPKHWHVSIQQPIVLVFFFWLLRHTRSPKIRTSTITNSTNHNRIDPRKALVFCIKVKWNIFCTFE